jgi:hybrid cluster-associated redox disulfide protein
MAGKKNGPITRNMLLGEVVRKHPEAAMVMLRRGMHCMLCGMAAHETIEQGARAHGIGEKEIEKLLREMNNAAAGRRPGKDK